MSTLVKMLRSISLCGKLLIGLSIIFGGQGFGSEVDNFTLRYSPLPDSKEIINKKANDLLKKTLRKINKKNHKCEDEQKLYRSLRRDFGLKLLNTRLVRWIWKKDDVSKHYLKPKESVYQYWNFKDSGLLTFFYRFIPVIMGPEFNFDGNRIGLDKFEHLFQYGFKIFKKHYLEMAPDHEIFLYGYEDEYGILGLKFTGVFSYADMSADFNGMRFWNDMLKKNPDYLGREIGPYITCKWGKWIPHQEIDFSNYIDASMDEGINCSKFHNRSVSLKFKKRIQELEAKNGERYTCPIFPEKHLEMKDKYGKYSIFLINDDGNEKVPYPSFRNVFKDLLERRAIYEGNIRPE